MHHPVSPLRALRRRAAKSPAIRSVEALEDRIAPAFTASLNGTTVTFTGGALNDSLTLISENGFLKHNLASAGDVNYASDFDMVPGDGAVETKLSTGSAFTVLVKGGTGLDRLDLGTDTSSAAGLANGTFNVDGEGGPDDFLTINFSAETAGRNLSVTATQVSTPGGPTVNYTTFENLDIIAGSGNDTFTLNGSAAGMLYTLEGRGGTNTVAATADGNFVLTSTHLNVTAPGFGSGFQIGGQLLGVISVANLTGGSGNNQFDVSDWLGSGTLTGLGGVNTLIAARNAAFTLTDTSLAASNGLSMTLAGIQVANLTALGPQNSFDVSSWSGTANLDGGTAGAVDFKISFAGSGTGTVNVTAGTGPGSLTVNGTANNDTFVALPGKFMLGLEAVNYSGPINAITLDGRGGNDPLTIALGTVPIASANTTFTYIGGGQAGDVLTFSGTGAEAATWIPGAANAGSVTIGASTYNYSTANGGLGFSSLASLLLQPGAGSDDFTLNGAAGTLVSNGPAQTATLTLVPTLNVNLGNGDGPNGSVADTFSVNGLPAGVTSLDVKLGSGPDHLNISGLTTLAGITFTANGGATGPDTIRFTGNVNVTLSDTALTFPGGSIAIAQFEDAVLIGGAGDNQFTISDWTGTGSIDGMGGTDTLTASNDVAAIGLSDTAFTRTGHGDFSLLSIEDASLLGGAGDNAFTISGYTGQAGVNGGGGNDSLTVTAANAFTMTLVNEISSKISYGGSLISVDSIGSYHLHGTALGLIGDDFANAVWTPSVTGNSGGGTLDLEETAHRLVYFDGALASVVRLNTLTLQTPAGADAITLGADGNGFATIGGSVGGPNPFAVSTSFKQVQKLIVDLGSNDAPGGATDTITINSLSGEIDLSSLTLKTGEGDDVITFADTVTSLNLPFPSGGISIDAGLGTDQIVANAPSVDLGLSTQNNTSSLTYGGTSGLTFTDVEQFDLTARRLSVSGADNETVAWTPGRDVVHHSSLAAHAGSLNAPGSFFGTVLYHLDSSLAAPLTIQDVYTVNLVTPAGTLPAETDTFTLAAGANNGELTLTGTTGSDAHGATLTDIEVLGIDLGAGETSAIADKLTVKSLAMTGLTTLTVSTGTGADTLELDSALTDLGLGTNLGEGFSFDGGGGGDTIELTSISPIHLGPATLAIGNGGTLTYANTEFFVLDGGVSGQVNYTGNGTEDFAWFPDSQQTQQGTANFSGKALTYTGQLGVFSTLSLTLNTPAGADAFTLSATATLGKIDGTVGATAQHAIFSGVPTVTLDLGTNDGTTATSDTLTVSSLGAPGLTTFALKTGAGNDQLTLTIANLKNSTWDAGAGTDTLEVTADVSMTLAGGSLHFTDNVNHTSDLGTLTLTGSAVEVANLTGGASANLFRFNGWSGAATVKAGDGNDTIDLSGGFSGTGSFQGEGNDDTFILQADLASVTTRALAGAGSGATLDGGSGTDTIVASANLDLTLTDALLTRTIPKTKTTPAQSVTNALAGFEHAMLSGAASTNLLDARQFSGTATLTGEGGIDNLIGSKGGGDLYGFHANATAAEMKTALYTRDNFFASAAATTDRIHATTKAGTFLSFRYSPTAVTYTIPNAAGGTASVGGGLSIELSEGAITAVEGSIFGDRLTGNKKVNFLVGGKGNDTLKAIGFDYLYGGPGADRLLGATPFKFQNTNYPIPNSPGVTAVRTPAPFPRLDAVVDAISALIVKE